MADTKSDFKSRYLQLNPAQKKAVESIDGPLLVVAGPGTGKTELLSMRAANILEKTDSLPSNILCLTFTESGASAMRERLSTIIGADAYRVAIHTFHSFGSDIIARYGEHFYHGAELEPADELMQYEIIESIFDELSYTHPLATKHAGEYVHLSDAIKTISELKRSGLTSEELRQILANNREIISQFSPLISEVFADRISSKTLHQLAPIAEQAAEMTIEASVPTITPYASVLAFKLAEAIQEANKLNSTKPITAWKNLWCTKSSDGLTILKDEKSFAKIESMVDIYSRYLQEMERASRYDYDDMILQLVHAIETQPDLRAQLQETYQYIMVDEFQDTNLAQLRIIFSLTDGVEQPNIMAVGDDDQAIYSFQGADINNIHRFRGQFSSVPVIVLTDNYRSTSVILDLARRVIIQGAERLENSLEGLTKQLTAHREEPSEVSLTAYMSLDTERASVAKQIARQIASGVRPDSITVIARRHHELIALLPYLSNAGISVNYEWRDDALTHETVVLIERLLRVLDALSRDAHQEANSLLPEILAHPAFGFEPADIYKLSLASHRNHQDWLEIMQITPIFKPFADWLLVRGASVHIESLEQQIDNLLGVNIEDESEFVSPLASYYFSSQNLEQDPELYLETLEALRTLRDAIRTHYPKEAPSVALALAFIDARRQLGAPLTVVRSRAEQLEGHINLMSAHKSKGLEFDHVYVIGAVDAAWGENVRVRSRLIRYPANLPLAPAGGNYDERLRLFYVAITRAKRQLHLSYSKSTASKKSNLPASFLIETSLKTREIGDQTTEEHIKQVEIDWRSSLMPRDSTLKQLLASRLDSYKLSVTHLNNFLDVSRGGPVSFLTNNLLRFPQAKSAAAHYGTAVHATLQHAHDSFIVSGAPKPVEDILGDFERMLLAEHLDERDHDEYLQRGSEALTAFLAANYQNFTTTQRTELGFGTQQVMVGEAHLTGALDLVDIDQAEKTIVVTDYKTGKPSRDWKGKTDYEKIKLHKYRQQLMFYQLMIENSRDYSKYNFKNGVLAFVEPDSAGNIHALDGRFSREELAEFEQLIGAVWQRIISLELPDISQYSPDYKGMLDFEHALIDNNI